VVEVRLGLTIMYADFDSKRRLMAKQLVTKLGGFDEIERVTARFSFTKDKTRQGVYKTSRQAWKKAYQGGATHHLVMEEDTTPCVKFLEAVKTIVGLLPDHIIDLWSGSAHAERKKAEDVGLLVDRFSSGQAVVMPVGLVDPWLTWQVRYRSVRDSLGLPECYSPDTMRDLWSVSVGRRTYHPLPSLIAHGDPRAANDPKLDHGSILGHPWAKSWFTRWFIGQDTDASQVDWEERFKRVFEPKATLHITKMVKSLPSKAQAYLGLR